MIHNRQTTVELQGERRTIAIRRGLPQRGIIFPLLWNLVVNELLEYTRNRIPSDLQGFAGVALDVITGNIPITLWLEAESAMGDLRLKNLNHWQHPPSGKLSMRPDSHITTNEKLLKSISEVRVPHD